MSIFSQNGFLSPGVRTTYIEVRATRLSADLFEAAAMRSVDKDLMAMKH